MDGAIHITTYTDEPYASYYARINPYGHIPTFYRIKGANEVYGISVTKFAGIGYNESSEKEFVNVYSRSGRLLWTLEEPENFSYNDPAFTKYGNYIL